MNTVIWKPKPKSNLFKPWLLDALEAGLYVPLKSRRPVCGSVVISNRVGFCLFLLIGFDNGFCAKRSFTRRNASSVEGFFFFPKRKGNAIIP